MINRFQELTPKNLNFLRKTTRKQCPVLIEPPVLGTQADGRLCKSISRPTVDMWTNPLGARPIGNGLGEK